MKFHCSYFNKSKLPDFFLNTLLEQSEQSEWSEQLRQYQTADDIRLQMISNHTWYQICWQYQTADDLNNLRKRENSVRNSTFTLWKSHQKKIILKLVMWLTCDMSIEFWNFTSETLLLFFSFLFMLESLYIINHNYWMKLSYTILASFHQNHQTY